MLKKSYNFALCLECDSKIVMTLIAILLVVSPLLAFLFSRLRDTHLGIDLKTKNDFAYARYVETHHRWVAFWIMLPGWLLALLVTIDYENYFYAWGNYSPIFHKEYDLPESGEVTLCISIVYLVVITLWMIYNFFFIARVNRKLKDLEKKNTGTA